MDPNLIPSITRMSCYNGGGTQRDAVLTQGMPRVGDNQQKLGEVH